MPCCFGARAGYNNKMTEPDLTSTPAPKRHWFQFSLRTLFIMLTVFGVWLGWQANVVHERKAMRNWIESGGGRLSVFYPPQPLPGTNLIILTGDFPDGEDFTVPIIRRWLGDEPVWKVEVRHDASADEVVKAKRLFPEAEVFNVLPKPSPSAGFF
jgi:hypothetical protein